MFIWTPELNTGNVEIDNQHKTLIGAINNLLAACRDGKGRSELDKTLRFLENYTIKHFEDEQQFMRRNKYPNLVAHIHLHEGFKKDLRAISRKIHLEGPTIALVADVNQKLGDWLVEHIKKVDKKVADYLRENA